MTTAEQLNEFRKTHPVQHLIVSGHEWSFIDCGEGENVIVNLPGIFGVEDSGAESIFPDISQLESHARIISIGYPINAAKTEEIIEGVKGILDKLEIAEVTFLAREFGASFSLRFLAKYKERVRSIIFTNYIHYSYLNPNLISILIAKCIIYFYRALPHRTKIERSKKALIHSLKNNPDPFWIPYYISAGEQNNWKGIANYYVFWMDLLKKRWRVSPEGLGAWKGRVLILNAEEVQDKVKTTEYSRPLFRNARLKIIKNSGPFFWMTNQEELLDAILNFLDPTRQQAIETGKQDSKDIGATSSNVTVYKRPKARYLLGLLCLIPFAGKFVGIGLFLLPLILYRDRRLALIGLMGFFLAVGIDRAVSPVFLRSPISQQGFAFSSQLQLNNLIKNVEFYKLQHGQYPDSLPQLRNDDKTAPIYDVLPFKGFNKKPGHYYNYQRVGDKYLLFSSGLDGIPNTPDDLYPKVLMCDSSKIGWIRAK